MKFNLLIKEKLDGFDINPKKYNDTLDFEHSFYKIVHQNPLHQESKTFFANMNHPNLIMINLHGNDKKLLPLH